MNQSNQSALLTTLFEFSCPTCVHNWSIIPDAHCVVSLMRTAIKDASRCKVKPTPTKFLSPEVIVAKQRFQTKRVFFNSASPRAVHEIHSVLRQFRAIDERANDYTSPGHMINKPYFDNFAKLLDKLSQFFLKVIFLQPTNATGRG